MPPSTELLTPTVVRRLLRQQVYVAVLAVVAIWFLYTIRDIMPIFLFSFILAYLLSPIVRRVSGPEGQGVSLRVAAAVVYVVLIAALGGVLFVGYAALRNEVGNLAHNFASYRDQVLHNLRLQESTGLLKSLPANAKDAVNNAVINVDSVASDLARRTLPGLVKAAPRLIELIAVPIVAYYLLVDYKRFLGFMRKLAPSRGVERFDTLIEDINASLRGYLVGQITLSAIAGVAAFAILTLNGVRPALVVGIAAVILELIPVIGPLTWVVVSIVLTAVQRPDHTVIVAVLAILADQIDMHILAPRILGGHLRLHPAVVIFALLAGNALLGILGILLAAPVAAIIYITLQYLVTEGALSAKVVVPASTETTVDSPPAPTKPSSSQALEGEAPPARPVSEEKAGSATP